jgi:beta-barrel assembly-enhancing protease
MPKLTIILLFSLLSLIPAPLAAKGMNRPIILLSGPETSDFLNEIGHPLLKAAGIIPESVHFHVMLNPSLNAMALPSNDIIFNSGLLQKAESKAEVAGVMAHEIAHLAAGHHIQLQAEMKNVSLQTLLVGIVGVAVGAMTGSGKIVQATVMGGSASAKTNMLASQRQKETQADRLAIRYLAKAGYEPNGLALFMERIQKEQQGTAMPPPYLLSHPLSSHRLVEIERLAKEIRPTTRRPHLHNRSLQRVQAKLLAGGSVTPNSVIKQFKNRLKTDPDDFVSQYGLAIALRYAGQLPESEAQLNRLLAKHPKDPYLFRERGRTRMDWGRAAQAERDFRQALKSRPKNHDLLYWLAFALKEQEKYRQASRILRKLTIKYPKKARNFFLLGMVEGKGRRLAAGHLALGRYYALILNIKTAIWHFDESIRLSPKHSVEHNIARSEKEQLQAHAKKIKKPNLNAP